ncbi:MAG: hypothetical protein AAGH89_03700 [Verrucomicrobiota bacterium]
MPRLNINFSGPKDGWLGIRIQADGEEMVVQASHTPHDTLTEFAEALVQILETGSSKSIPINEEPEASTLQFFSEGDHLLIQHTMEGRKPNSPTQTIRAPFQSSTREIARKLKFLYEDVGYDGFVKHWRRRPPKEQIARAWSQFAP